MFAQVSADGLGWTFGNLSAFTTGYSRSTGARDPALWLQSQFSDVVGTENVVLVENSFNQPNVVVDISCAENSTNDEIVIIGGHFDSINKRSSNVQWEIWGTKQSCLDNG
ncbi:hypothetical protein AURDEDRAFT_163672 [Auricularia subglabra TFB-10046 SS5]|nr:hypothetical protein AURDEDRAFT_163672 [Auricularia subglabra TFB-10046 SS5]